jgi:hypothetical protein
VTLVSIPAADLMHRLLDAGVSVSEIVEQTGLPRLVVEVAAGDEVRGANSGDSWKTYRPTALGRTTPHRRLHYPYHKAAGERHLTRPKRCPDCGALTVVFLPSGVCRECEVRER